MVHRPYIETGLLCVHWLQPPPPLLLPAIMKRLEQLKMKVMMSVAHSPAEVEQVTVSLI